MSEMRLWEKEGKSQMMFLFLLLLLPREKGVLTADCAFLVLVKLAFDKTQHKGRFADSRLAFGGRRKGKKLQ